MPDVSCFIVLRAERELIGHCAGEEIAFREKTEGQRGGVGGKESKVCDILKNRRDIK